MNEKDEMIKPIEIKAKEKKGNKKVPRNTTTEEISFLD